MTESMKSLTWGHYLLDVCLPMSFDWIFSFSLALRPDCFYTYLLLAFLIGFIRAWHYRNKNLECLLLLVLLRTLLYLRLSVGRTKININGHILSTKDIVKNFVLLETVLSAKDILEHGLLILLRFSFYLRLICL